MVLVNENGKEIRRVGSAIIKDRCRDGALGKVDAISFSEFKRLGPLAGNILLSEAYREKGNRMRQVLSGEGMTEIIQENGKTQALVKIFFDGSEKIAKIETDYYETFFNALAGLEITKSDIQIFIWAATKFEQRELLGDDMGNFLSALINRCSEDDIHLYVEALPFKISTLGNHNTKRVTIYGSLGSLIAMNMLSGKFVVYGDVNDIAIGQKGGRAVVNGDVLGSPGFGQDNLGDQMEAGDVVINGNIYCGLPTNASGGNIFQYGRQLVRNGGIIARPENR